MNTETLIRTSDLALTTTLRLSGFEPVRLELLDRKALWVFENGPRMVAMRRRYERGDCSVEPKAYNIRLHETRNMMFEFLQANGIDPPNPRR